MQTTNSGLNNLKIKQRRQHFFCNAVRRSLYKHPVLCSCVKNTCFGPSGMPPFAKRRWVLRHDPHMVQPWRVLKRHGVLLDGGAGNLAVRPHFLGAMPGFRVCSDPYPKPRRSIQIRNQGSYIHPYDQPTEACHKLFHGWNNNELLYMLESATIIGSQLKACRFIPMSLLCAMYHGKASVSTVFLF